MAGFNFWKQERRTFEGYLRTNRKDWFYAVDRIVDEIAYSKTIVDIGSGDGHSTRQILSRLPKETVCDLVEPDHKALGLSLSTLKERNIARVDSLTLYEYLKFGRRFDAALSIHTNYYWGRNGVEQRSKLYNECLDGYAELGKKALMLTSPSTSDYYRVVEINPFPEYVFSEYVIDHYRKNGLKVKVVECPMGHYVDDIHKDGGAAIELWKFLHDTEKNPTLEQIAKFLERIKNVQHGSEINFRDQLLVIGGN